MAHGIDTDELELARPGRRAAACALDVALLVAAGSLGRVWSVGVGAVLVLGLLLVQAVVLARTGSTAGRAATGLRTLDVETRAPLGLPRVLARGVVLVAGALLAGVGLVVVLLSPLFDRTGRLRGWHDRAAGDEVFDVRRAPRRPGPAWPDEDPSPVRSAGARGSHDLASSGPTVAGRTPDGADATSAAPPLTPAWLAPSTSGTAQLEAWLDSEAGQPTLVLAPIAPDRRGPDLDTRAVPVVRPAPVEPPAQQPVGYTVQQPGRHAVEPPVPSTVPSTGPSTVPVLGHGYPDLDPEVEMTRRAAPRGDVVAETPAVAALRPASAEIALGDGRRLTVERTALVGRNPTSDSGVQLVRVVDPGRSVSKTHLQIGVEPGGVWVADRGSTNGTVVTLPGGAQVVCGVDQQVRLRVGSVVAFGGCTLWLVREPGAPAGS